MPLTSGSVWRSVSTRRVHRTTDSGGLWRPGEELANDDPTLSSRRRGPAAIRRLSAAGSAGRRAGHTPPDGASTLGSVARFAAGVGGRGTRAGRFDGTYRTGGARPRFDWADQQPGDRGSPAAPVCWLHG